MVCSEKMTDTFMFNAHLRIRALSGMLLLGSLSLFD